jgi:hypothetical protein
MSDAEIEHKREEDERLDTAEDPNEEVRHDPETAHRGTSPETVHTTHTPRIKNASREGHELTAQHRKRSPL